MEEEDEKKVNEEEDLEEAVAVARAVALSGVAVVAKADSLLHVGTSFVWPEAGEAGWRLEGIFADDESRLEEDDDEEDEAEGEFRPDMNRCKRASNAIVCFASACLRSSSIASCRC